jgi:hypothetical protein
MVLPNKITAQGWVLAPIAWATRPQGAPLTVILGGKRMPGTEDGPGPVWQARGIGAALRRGLPTCGSGAARPGGGGAPAGLPPEGARHGRRPGVGQQPRQLPALVLAVVPVSVTRPRSMSSRPLPRVRATGPTLGAPKACP